MAKPKWATPDRQAHLVKLFLEYANKCLLGHPNCPELSHYIKHEAKAQFVPIAKDIPCKDIDGNPITDRDGNQVYLTVYGIKTTTTYEPKTTRLYELKWQEAIRHWKEDDRRQREAEWQAERKALHSLAERRYPLRGTFSIVSKDIFFAEQPQFYFEAMGVSGLTLKPFAKVRLASSYITLFVDLGDIKKSISKNAKRKAFRYSRLTGEVYSKVKQAVRHYLSR